MTTKAGRKRKRISAEVKCLAKDIHRAHRLNAHPLTKEGNIETLRWAEQSIGHRIVKLVDRISEIAEACNRFRFTDSRKYVCKAHDTFCREHKGRLPTFRELFAELEHLLPDNRLPSERTIRYIVRNIPLPMASASTGRRFAKNKASQLH